MKKDAENLSWQAKQLVYMTYSMTANFLKYYFIFIQRTSEIKVSLLSRSFSKREGIDSFKPRNLLLKNVCHPGWILRGFGQDHRARLPLGPRDGGRGTGGLGKPSASLVLSAPFVMALLACEMSAIVR